MDPRDGIDPREALASGHIEQASGMERAGFAPAEWYDATWNPTGGCSPVSPGCDHCEALQTVSKLARIGGEGRRALHRADCYGAVRLAMDRRDSPAIRCVGLAPSAAHSATYPNRFVGRSVP